MEKNIKKYFPVFVLPTFISFAVVFLIPFVLGIYLSFTEFTTVDNAQVQKTESQTEKKNVVVLTDDYIRSLENYLMLLNILIKSMLK